MKKQEIIAAMEGKTIKRVILSDTDTFGNAVSDDDALISGIVLEDGTEVKFFGSPQIEIDDVWVDIV